MATLEGSDSLWDELWELESKALRLDPLVTGEASDYRKYRAALTRGKDVHYQDLIRKSSASSGFVLVEGGVVKSLKHMLNGKCLYPSLEIYREHLIFHAGIHSPATEKNKVKKAPIFVHVFITTPSPCDLALGMYHVSDFLGGQRNLWKLVRAEEDMLTSDSHLLTTADASSSATTGDQVLAASSIGEQRQVEQTSFTVAPFSSDSYHKTETALHSGQSSTVMPTQKLTSLRFSHGGDDFDSQLECIHREAFRRMGVKYFASRSSFHVGHALRMRAQKTYTPDGVLHVPFGAPHSPLTLFHVEIKPGPLTLEESDLCFALCQTQTQPVLCITGGRVTDATLTAHLPSVDTKTSSNGDYSNLPRHRPFVEMSLYSPQGVGLPPAYYPSVVWCSSEQGTFFLSNVDHADPLRREEVRTRLLRIYYLATKDAGRISRGGGDPY